MTTANEKQPTIRLGNGETTWSDLLRDAISIPGKLLEAYTAFHNFSVGNSLLALFQCYEREITPGPLNTYKGWRQLGPQVRKGEKAITLRMPLAYKNAFAKRTRTEKPAQIRRPKKRKRKAMKSPGIVSPCVRTGSF
jgi:N-terminal domain of anti-restriction factor ArdC